MRGAQFSATLSNEKCSDLPEEQASKCPLSGWVCSGASNTVLYRLY